MPPPLTNRVNINRQKNGLIGLLDHTVLTIEIDNQLLQKRKERGLIMLSCPQHDDELVDSGEEDNYEFASHAKTKNSDIISNHYQSVVHWW